MPRRMQVADPVDHKQLQLELLALSEVHTNWDELVSHGAAVVRWLVPPWTKLKQLMEQTCFRRPTVEARSRVHRLPSCARQA